jgi:hypothetical protein
MKRDGRTPRRHDHLPPKLLPICDESTGGRCNQTLSERFEQAATRAAVKAMFGAGVLHVSEAGRAVEWWLKTALLSVHPRAYEPGDIQKPVWDGGDDHDLFTWTVTGLSPPSNVSLWVALPTSTSYGDAEALPRSGNNVIDLPTWTLTGRDRVSRISVFGLASLQFHLLYHPGWDVTHPFEASGQAIRIWPWAGGELDLSAAPRLDGPSLRGWLDLWGTPVTLMLEPGYDPSDRPWVLAPGWARAFPFMMAGVIGAMM